MSILTWLLLATASAFAGFVDAVAGGGGLIQLPALLIGIHEKPIAMILGTNKVPSVFGTSSSALTYFKRIKPDLHLTISMALPAFIGSVLGARLAASFPANIFRPVLVGLLILVALYTWRRPHFGMTENLRFTHRTRRIVVGICGLLLGFYDGIFGPGTGSFLLFVLVGVIGYEFLKASATAKLVNISTNIAAIITFQRTGHIWWHLGLILALANVTGAIFGARLAIKGGSPLVRKTFLFVTFLLIAKVGYDWLHQ